MTSIIKVDTIQDTAGNNIINENSNTITIGASGDTTNIVGTLQNNGAAVDNTPAWQVFATSSPTGLAFNANNTVPLDTVGFDSDSGHNTSTYKYTVPEAGKYQLNFQYGVESVSGGAIITILAEIYNETTSKILLRRRTVSNGDHASTNQPLVDSISGIKSLAANDVIYCRVYVYATSGSLKINGNSDQEWSQFSGCKLIGV